jgi:hypothetical protein
MWNVQILGGAEVFIRNVACAQIGGFGPKPLRSLALAVATAAVMLSPAHALETRSYVVEWFSQASHSQDGDCPGGINPPTRLQYYESFALLGKSPDEVEELMKVYAEGGMPAANVKNMMRLRGRIGEEPVNGFVHPWTVADPQLTSVVGEHALGFNLDGQTTESSFIEPRTEESGIDNQLFRAMGCIEQFRGTFEHIPTFWAFIWGSMKETTPAWLISVSGADLDKDGPVTITFDRAVEHIVFGPTGDAVSDMTYRADPDPRSHHVFDGQIENGVLSITKPGELRMILDTLSFPEFALSNTHLRMKIAADSLSGIVGGYQPIWDYYFGIANGGLAYENMIINDAPGIYHSLKRHADGNPDPETGEYTSISSAYRIDAVPVFVVQPEVPTYRDVSSR